MAEPAPDAADTSAAFGDRTPWSAGAATVFACITIAVAYGVARMAQPLHAPLGMWLGGARTRPGIDAGLTVNTMLTMLVLYGVVIAMVWWGAARFGGVRPRVLSLGPRPRLATVLASLAGMIALLAPWNLAVYLLWPDQFADDLRPFWEFARSPAVWLAALVLVVGAPLSEELLFRGFLLPALTKTRHGFRGAAVLTTLGWTLLHGHSILGLIEVGLIGLYFSWLMWRHASLWLPIGLHALYNSVQLAALALWPGG